MAGEAGGRVRSLACRWWRESGGTVRRTAHDDGSRMYGSGGGDGSSVRVVTYNILADCYIKSFLLYCPEEHRWMGTRHAKIMAELREMNADVLCLQEVEPQHFPLLQAELRKEGYEGCYLKKTSEEVADGWRRKDGDGVATFFKRNRFELLHSDSMLLNDVARSMAREEGVDVKRGRLIYNNIALTLWLRQKESFRGTRGERGRVSDMKHEEDEMNDGRYSCFEGRAERGGSGGNISIEEMEACNELSTDTVFMVSNVSIYFDNVRVDSQTLQIALFLEELWRIRESHIDESRTGCQMGGNSRQELSEGNQEEDSLRVIICGDFNTTPDKAGYHLMKHGRLDPSGRRQLESCPQLPALTSAGGELDSTLRSNDLSADSLHLPLVNSLSHRFRHSWPTMRSVYAEMRDGEEPEFTNYVEDFQGCLSYIWLASPAIDILGVMELPAKSVVEPYIGCPNEIFPSDHLPLLIEASAW